MYSGIRHNNRSYTYFHWKIGLNCFETSVYKMLFTAKKIRVDGGGTVNWWKLRLKWSQVRFKLVLYQLIYVLVY